MQTEDKPAFASTLAGLASIKRVTLTPESFELWWQAMQDWSLENFRMVAAHLLKTCQFMPSPKDFEDMRKVGKMTAGESWALALWFVRSGTYHHKASSGDEATDACAKMVGGYRAIGMETNEGLPFMEKRYCEHHETFSDRTEKRRLPQIGLSELKRLQTERTP